MNFFKENASKISRLIITHIAMSIFGLALGFSIVMSGAAPSVQLLICVGTVVFYAVLVYSTMWEFGAKDKPAFDAGRQKNAMMLGFFISLAAEAIFIVIAVIYAVSSLFGETSYFAGNACFISNIVLWLASGFFTGAMSFLESISAGHLARASVYLIGSLLVSVVSAIGYTLGTKDITIIPKNKNTKK